MALPKSIYGTSGKNLPADAGNKRNRFDPWVVRSPGGDHGNPLQYSCLGSPVDRGAWQATVHGAAKELDTTEHTHK